MKPIPEALALTKLCPIMADGAKAVSCRGSHCMAWSPCHFGWLRDNYGGQFTEEDKAGVCELIDKRSDE